MSPRKCTLPSQSMQSKHANMNRRRGNGRSTLWSNQYASALTRSYYILPKMIHTCVTCKSSVVRDAIDQQARLCSATAVTQTRLQMPPGQEAKINTTCSGAGMLYEHIFLQPLRGSLNRPFNSTNRQTEIRMSVTVWVGTKCIFLFWWKLLAVCLTTPAIMTLDTCFHVYFTKHSAAFVAKPLGAAYFRKLTAATYPLWK